MPLKIYLDTSDYAALYRLNLTEVERSVLAYLREQIKAGRIEIGFSWPIIWELLQDFSEEYRADRVRRAEFVSELCGQNAFRFMFEIGLGKAFSRDGHWYPGERKPISIKKLERIWFDAILANPAWASNRQSRRALNNPTGRRTFIKNNRALCDLRKINLKGMPLSKRFIEGDYFFRYMIGEFPEEVADRELLKCVTDPVQFLNTWFDCAGKENPFTENIHLHGARLKDGFENLREALERVRSLTRQIKEAKRRMHKAKMPREMIRELEAQIRGLEASRVPENIIKFNHPIWEQMGPYVVDVVRAYIRANSESDREIKRSDLADLHHAAYIPHCDLWRGDTTFSNILIEQQVAYWQKIVPKLSDLPRRISERLS